MTNATSTASLNLDGIAQRLAIQELTDRSAKGSCSVIVSGELKTGGLLHATAYYEDDYQRVDGAWKFRARKTIPYTKPQLAGLTI